MAKVGKSPVEVDPFAAGKQAFGALDEALGALDARPVEVKGAEPQPAHEKAPAPTKKAVTKPDPPEDRESPKPPIGGGGEKATPRRSESSTQGTKRARRFLATDDEMRAWQSAAMRLGASTGARVDFSKMTRALWEIYLRHEDDILRNIPEGEAGWQRPSNADAVGLAELDERLASLLNDGLMVASRRPRNARGG